MKRVYADCPKPSSSRRQQLDIPILSNIEPKQIKVWFQNRSIGNPYLLAENRHYTFYLWRKIINVHWSSKYLMVPHVYVWFSIFRILGKFQKKIRVLVHFLACAAVLIPSPLIEFRYYT